MFVFFKSSKTSAKECFFSFIFFLFLFLVLPNVQAAILYRKSTVHSVSLLVKLLIWTKMATFTEQPVQSMHLNSRVQCNVNKSWRGSIAVKAKKWGGVWGIVNTGVCLVDISFHYTSENISWCWFFIEFSIYHVQCDQLYMAVCFWYLVKSAISSLRVYSSEHCTSNFLEGARKPRSCFSGLVVA